MLGLTTFMSNLRFLRYVGTFKVRKFGLVQYSVVQNHDIFKKTAIWIRLLTYQILLKIIIFYQL